MTISTLPIIRWRLAQLTVHLVVAVIALVVVGGATRVMEAGLACPDWPLCFGSFLPGHHMNLQVFLEWFHRLDAFLIGIVLLVQLFLTFFWRSQLPRWVPFFSTFLVILVLIQGGLGALTVLNLLPSGVVTAHLTLGLTLVALLSGFSQNLLSKDSVPSPIWWRVMSGLSAFLVILQSLIGARMSTLWAAQRCLSKDESCYWLYLHRSSAILVTFFILIFVGTAILKGGWPRSQWPFLVSILCLVFIQISLGLLTVNYGLSQPLLTVTHQLGAALLVAILSALAFRRPPIPLTQSMTVSKTLMEPCHG